MFGLGHSIAALDVATGPFALMVFSAAAAVVVVAVLVRLALQRVGFDGMAGVLWFCALAVVGGMAAYPAFEYFTMPNQAVERRAIEARAAELTERALVPGSPLGCLDAVANALVENACEKPLFASAETVAAAVAYVDARFSLLTAGAKLAERDATYRPSYERLRRGLEADRYGIVAHVLSTRGCDVVNCPEIRLLRDSSHVVANIKAHAFEAALGVHALAWPNSTGNAAVASAPSTTPPTATTGVEADGVGRARHHGREQVRFSVGELDPADQHHERRAGRVGVRDVETRGAEASGGGAAPVEPARGGSARNRACATAACGRFAAASTAADADRAARARPGAGTAGPARLALSAVSGDNPPQRC